MKRDVDSGGAVVGGVSCTNINRTVIRLDGFQIVVPALAGKSLLSGERRKFTECLCFRYGVSVEQGTVVVIEIDFLGRYGRNTARGVTSRRGATSKTYTIVYCALSFLDKHVV